MTKGCYAEGKDGYCEYASKQAFIIQNQYRAEKGIAPLIWSNELYNFAKIRSKDLTKLYEHTRPDGQGCQDFLLIILVKKDVGYFKKTLDCKPNLQVTKKYVVHLIVIRKTLVVDIMDLK